MFFTTPSVLAKNHRTGLRGRYCMSCFVADTWGNPKSSVSCVRWDETSMLVTFSGDFFFFLSYQTRKNYFFKDKQILSKTNRFYQYNSGVHSQILFVWSFGTWYCIRAPVPNSNSDWLCNNRMSVCQVTWSKASVRPSHMFDKKIIQTRI